MTNTTLDDPRELEALLPWYLNGTVSPQERTAIEAWLAEDAEARLLLDAMREEQEVTEAANAEIRIPDTRAGLSALLASIDAEASPRPAITERPVRRAQVARTSLFERLSSWLPTPGLRLAAGAAGVLVVVQAAAIAVMLSTGSDAGNEPTDPGFQVASGTESATMGPRFLLTFNGDLTISELDAFLAEHKLRLVDSPAASIYEVELTGTDVDAVDVAALEAVLEGDSRVQQVIGRSD
jgi:hypothetical protein